MRKGLLWVVGLSFIGAVASGQEPPMVKELPQVSGVAVLPATGSPKGTLPPATTTTPKSTPLPAETVTVFEPRPERCLSSWVSAEYLLWWIKGNTTPPLVTASDSFGDFPPGAIGQPGTSILFGNSPVNYGAFSGVRVGAGVEVAKDLWIEANYFLLERRANNFRVTSDDNGAPIIASPFFNTAIGLEDALLTSNPAPGFGIWTGSANVVSSSRMQGYEINMATTAACHANWRFGALLGFRAVHLEESLTISNQFIPRDDGVLTFNGAPMPAGTLFGDQDSFRTGNNFYGGQIGGRAEWKRGAFSFSVVGKVAFGANQEVVTIDGVSGMVTPDGGITTAPGGIYALPSNMGRYYKSTFAIVPEVGLNFGVALTERLTAKAGYSFLYWSRVARPGEQIDTNLHESQIPTHQFFGLTQSDGRPAFQFRQTDFWTQGINFGLEFTY